MTHRHATLGVVLAAPALAVLLAAVTASGAHAQAPSLEELRERASSSPRDAEAQAAYGHALLRTGRHRAAERQLKAAARLRGNTAEALYDVARVAFARGDYRAARAACAPIRREERDGVLAHVCMARAFLVWNRSARAFEELEAALAKDPQHTEALLALGDAHRLRADVPKAEAAYLEAARQATADARPHLGLGRLYVAVGRHGDAVEALRRARELDRGSPAIQYQLGRLVGGEEGRDLLSKALTTRPEWADPQAALATLHLWAGEAEKAASAFRRALRLQDDLAPAHSGLGRALIALEQYEEAEAALEQALALVPNDPTTQLALAELYEKTDRNERAFEQYRQAADANPGDPAALLRAARLGLRLRRDVLAAGFLDRVLEHHPDLSAALALYGDVMRVRGDRPGAGRYYRRALEGRGKVDRPRIEQALAELERPIDRGEELQPAMVSPR